MNDKDDEQQEGAERDLIAWGRPAIALSMVVILVVFGIAFAILFLIEKYVPSLPEIFIHVYGIILCVLMLVILLWGAGLPESIGYIRSDMQQYREAKAPSLQLESLRCFKVLFCRVS